MLSQIIAKKIKVDGKAENIPLAFVYADAISGAHDPQHSLNGNPNGFGGYPKLHQKRQAVIVAQTPVSFAAGETLEFTLHQKAKVTGNQACSLRNYQLHLSNEPAWNQLTQLPSSATTTRGLEQDLSAIQRHQGRRLAHHAAMPTRSHQTHPPLHRRQLAQQGGRHGT